VGRRWQAAGWRGAAARRGQAPGWRARAYFLLSRLHRAPA